MRKTSKEVTLSLSKV
ncbi:hypothetical protein [Enterococcus lemanii]|uniref:Uncharacterized protein n=1 Tax=Enterococcus lemanii TaxID=1159752 RepID=A0ABV9MU21_9ENTE